MVDGFHRRAVGAEKLVVDADEFQVRPFGFGDDARPESRVGRANHEALRTASREIVDRAEHFLAVGRADFYEGEAEFLRGLVGEFPLELEPRLLGLLHEEADFHRRSVRGERGKSERNEDAKKQGGRDFHGAKNFEKSSDKSPPRAQLAIAKKRR